MEEECYNLILAISCFNAFTYIGLKAVILINAKMGVIKGVVNLLGQFWKPLILVFTEGTRTWSGLESCPLMLLELLSIATAAFNMVVHRSRRLLAMIGILHVSRRRRQRREGLRDLYQRKQALDKKDLNYMLFYKKPESVPSTKSFLI